MPSQNFIDASGMNFKETELTLGLPGESRLLVLENGAKAVGSKRGYILGNPVVACGAKALTRDQFENNEVSSPAKAPEVKTQVVGWPPVRASRRNAVKSCKFVKVAVDGAPYLSKVDLEMYSSYQQLPRDFQNEKKTMDQLNGGGEYVAAYEDKDGDWMMIGDVPWKMFAESCKRLRLMKITEAVRLGPRTLSGCSSSS